MIPRDSEHFQMLKVNNNILNESLIIHMQNLLYKNIKRRKEEHASWNI